MSIIKTDRVRAQRACTFPEFLTVLNNPAPAFASIPRSIREHVSYRSFGDFGTVLMAERPASADLSNRVERWRVVEVAADGDLPLQAHPDQAAEDRRHRFAFAATSLTLTSWIIIGVVAAAWSGKL